MDRKQFRNLAIALLDDENGINAEAYNQLQAIGDTFNSQDIFRAVGAEQGRFFLPESHELTEN